MRNATLNGVHPGAGAEGVGDGDVARQAGDRETSVSSEMVETARSRFMDG
jgi:hypothetical protein